MSAAEMRRIIADAEMLGISFFVIAGGEPLIRPEIVTIARDFPKVIFLLATNGTLLDEKLIRRLVEQRNIVPVLSMEGNAADTDDRRGEGVHEQLRRKMRELSRAGVFFAVALTVTTRNFDVVTDGKFVQEMIVAGCRLFLVLEYTPITEGTGDWVLADAQRVAMKSVIAGFRRRFGAVFVAVPWDEEEQGGCLGLGRAFVHISPQR